MIILCLRLEFKKKSNSLAPVMIDEIVHIANDFEEACNYLKNEEAQWDIEYCEDIPDCHIREFTGFVLVDGDLSLTYKWNLKGELEEEM